jgi:hypothetical protein
MTVDQKDKLIAACVGTTFWVIGVMCLTRWLPNFFLLAGWTLVWAIIVYRLGRKGSQI